MTDYKELIGDIRICLIAQPNQTLYKQLLREATNAIVQLVKERDAAVDCIYAIEDDLDRGNDNDWAREHIKEWRGVQEVEHETD